MTFDNALEKLLSGAQITRLAWHGAQLQLTEAESGEQHIRVVNTRDKASAPWLGSEIALADDWVVVEDKQREQRERTIIAKCKQPGPATDPEPGGEVPTAPDTGGDEGAAE